MKKLLLENYTLALTAEEERKKEGWVDGPN
jgi:hypothetical protein